MLCIFFRFGRQFAIALSFYTVLILGLSKKRVSIFHRLKLFCKITNSHKMSESNEFLSQWDANSGVWTGVSGKSMTPGVSIDMIPRPLYVLGYGSLLWRPGVILEKLTSFKCCCPGQSRFFAQRSADHRGTPDFPGLVVTLIENDYLKEMGYNFEFDTISTYGRVWNVGENEELIKELIDELDHRERGGYVRKLVRVQVLEETPHCKCGEILQALVYIAPSTNPFFFLPKSQATLSKPFDHLMTTIADIISVATGPSGRNSDYLVNLAQYLNSHNLKDDLLDALVQRLQERLGPWHYNWFATNAVTDKSKELDYPSNLIGWGSNEYEQLSLEAKKPETIMNYASIVSSNRLSSIYHRQWLLCGGTVSAVLNKNRRLTLWGSRKLLYVFDKIADVESANTSAFTVCGVRGISISYDRIIIMLANGFTMEVYVDDVFTKKSEIPRPNFVVGYPCNDDSVRIRKVNERIFEFDINNADLPSDSVNYQVVKVAAGLGHSLALTNCGKVFGWGNNKYGQCFRERSAETPIFWCPPEGRVVDICCGAKHSLALDDSGQLWVCGDDVSGAVGLIRKQCFRAPRKVEWANDSVKWRRVCSGWSHVVARGVRVDGSIVVIGWGRNDMNQLGNASYGDSVTTPIELLLPTGQIKEIWTGSEFTFAIDFCGSLWSCGWNEHANLGHGTHLSEVAVCSPWAPVVDNMGAQINISTPWTESVACGGAHVICSID